jgi:hypothetical protein
MDFAILIYGETYICGFLQMAQAIQANELGDILS